MLFAITCTDKPGKLALRMETRPAHLDHLAAHQGQLLLVGPLLDMEGKPCGSLLVIEAEHRETAEAFAAADPYALAGLFESVVVRPFRAVFKDGQQL
jgi:uncharacterized protein YciI